MEAAVEGLLEPVPEDRMRAEEALALLTGKPRPARCGRQGWVCKGCGMHGRASE